LIELHSQGGRPAQRGWFPASVSPRAPVRATLMVRPAGQWSHAETAFGESEKKVSPAAVGVVAD